MSPQASKTSPATKWIGQWLPSWHINMLTKLDNDWTCHSGTLAPNIKASMKMCHIHYSCPKCWRSIKKDLRDKLNWLIVAIWLYQHSLLTKQGLDMLLSNFSTKCHGKHEQVWVRHFNRLARLFSATTWSYRLVPDFQPSRVVHSTRLICSGSVSIELVLLIAWICHVALSVCSSQMQVW